MKKRAARRTLLHRTHQLHGVNFLPAGICRQVQCDSHAGDKIGRLWHAHGKPRDLPHRGCLIGINAFPPDVRRTVGFDGLDLRDGTGGVILPHAHFSGVNRFRESNFEPVCAAVLVRRTPRVRAVACDGDIWRARRLRRGVLRLPVL